VARKNVTLHTLEAAKSLAAGFTTSPTLIRYLDNCAYQINITTSNSTGSFTVEGSLDYAIDEVTNQSTNAGNWTTLNLAGGTPTVAAANDTILIDLNQLPFNAIRLKYTSTVAGTGTAAIFVMARQLGG
jgi:hypothetical protein